MKFLKYDLLGYDPILGALPWIFVSNQTSTVEYWEIGGTHHDKTIKKTQKMTKHKTMLHISR